MKQPAGVLMMILFTICQVQGMEVVGETKIHEKKSLIESNEQVGYCGLIRSHDISCMTHDELKKRKELKAYLKASAQELPYEIRAYIAAKFVQLYLQDNSLVIESDPLVVLRILCRTQKMSSLTIGNKTFDWKDFITLKKEARDKLFIIGNPDPLYTCLTGFDNNFIATPNDHCTRAVYCLPQYCCGAVAPNIKFLEDQPQHIKKNLLVHQADYSSICFGCIPPCAVLSVSCCLLVGVVNLIALSCKGASCGSLWYIPATTCASKIGALALHRLLMSVKCCGFCGKGTCLAYERKFQQSVFYALSLK
jgi:hypothetical protein